MQSVLTSAEGTAGALISDLSHMSSSHPAKQSQLHDLDVRVDVLNYCLLGCAGGICAAGRVSGEPCQFQLDACHGRPGAGRSAARLVRSRLRRTAVVPRQGSHAGGHVCGARRCLPCLHCIHHTYLPLSCTPPHPSIIDLLLWWIC